MSSEIRRRINRDDGKYFQVGNRLLSGLEIVGLLLFVGAIALWQLHVNMSLSIIWALIVGSIGLVLTILGDAFGRKCR